MTTDIMKEIILELHHANFPVVGIVSDMGTSNMKLWSVSDVGHDNKCHFQYSCNESRKVFVLADVRHLLKLVRNHFLDSGFNISSNIINKTIVEQLHSVSISELTYVHKLTVYHLNLKGSDRQHVRLAAQVISNTMVNKG